MAAVREGVGIDDHLAFEQTWKAVEPELRRWLARRRVPASDRDDYLQEVAARLLVSDVPVHSFTDAVRWSMTVLRNLHIDRARACARTPLDKGGLDEELAGPPAPDVAAQVAARLALAAVAKEMSSWSAAQRDTLLRDEGSGTRRSSAFYVARHRLRLRLLEAIEGAAAFLAGIWRSVEPADVDRASAMVLIPPAAIACIVSFALLDGRGGADDAPPTAPPASRTARLPDIGANAGFAAVSRPSSPVVVPGTGSSQHGSEGRGRPAPAGGLLPPVEDEIEVAVDAPGDPYVEVDNDHGKEPLLCLTFPDPVTDVCFDPAG